MKKTVIIFIVLVLLGFWACHFPINKGKQKKLRTLVFPSYHPNYPPPAGANDTFQLSQDYPDTFDIKEEYTWQKIDFKTDYKNYMKAVLAYCLEGNVEVDFKVQNNKIRKWYHAPWLHTGLNGREFHHGLTRERPLPTKELHPAQNVEVENWAIGFYSPPGGYTIGKVWHSDQAPRKDLANFPEGTVSFKLLFTAGTPDKIPFLKDTKTWVANIYRCNPESRLMSPEEKLKCIEKRYDTTVRLLQIDIAVKDKRAHPSGWVFGTFIYDASQGGTILWDRIVPIGMMWGDDSEVDTLIQTEGAFINPLLRETILNQALILQGELKNPGKAFISHHGLGGRLNGPVDNPISSCTSCHSRAAITNTGVPAPIANFKLTRPTFKREDFLKYFATIPSGAGSFYLEGIQYQKLDYSLQLCAGLRNYYKSIRDTLKGKPLIEQTTEDFPEVSRNGLIQTNQ